MFTEADRELNKNLLWIDIDGRYTETKYFKEAILYLVFNMCELNPTNKVGNVIHEFLKTYFFKRQDYRRGVYKQIGYENLPILWKDRRAIERKKQCKLTFLANDLHNVGRVVEVHIIRTIVKPYIPDLNLKWSKMMALEKLKAVPTLLAQQSRSKYSSLTQQTKNTCILFKSILQVLLNKKTIKIQGTLP